jgi:two-component system, chemotaxis family, chemotaxis protein CheY
MRKLRMLIVEDEFLSRQLLLMYVEEYGHCDVAVNGNEAVTAVMSAYERKIPYDIVFMDIMLPEKDGQTALKEIREYEASLGILGNETCKVIMITALSDAGTVMESFKNQCEGYVTKPYSKAMVEEAIAKLDLEAAG